MKIYSKTGDKGYTKINNTNYRKDSELINLCGSIDELISKISLVYSFDNSYEEILFEIQKTLMLCNNIPIGDCILIENINFLEEKIDDFNKKLEPLKNFIIFKGKISSLLNVLRTKTRSIERIAVKNFYNENINNEHFISYLNRLSDLFFILARHSVNNLNNNKEINWKI